ncbi:MAG: hypothetical protein AAFP00_15520 [Bacteroidota bacterium]
MAVISFCTRYNNFIKAPSEGNDPLGSAPAAKLDACAYAVALHRLRAAPRPAQ